MDLLGTNDGMYRSSSSLFSSKTSLARGDLISFSPEEKTKKGSSREKGSESNKVNPNDAVESCSPLHSESSKAEVACSQGIQIRSDSKIDRGFSPIPDVYGSKRHEGDFSHRWVLHKSSFLGEKQTYTGYNSCEIY